MAQQSRYSSSRLLRALGVWGAGAFVVTNMVGTGIFTVPAFVRSATGSGTSALFVWILGGALALSGALCYAELATRMPHAGGEYHYLGRIYGPLWGFLSGWVSFLVGFSAAIAAAALGAVDYAAAAIPGWNAAAPVVAGGFISYRSLSAALLVLLFAAFHCSGVRPSGRLQATLAGSILGGIFLLVCSGFLTGKGAWNGVLSGAPGGGTWWVALIEVSFAYTGWNAAAYMAGEVDRPRRTLPRALIGGTLAVTVAYLALNLLFLYAIPPGSWQPRVAVGTMAAERLFGSFGGQAVSALIALAITGSVSAMTAAGPRVYFAMAADGLAPGAFARLSRANGAPVVATIFQSLVAAVLALTGAFETLLIYVGSALLLISGLTVAGVYLVRRRWPDAGPEVFRVPGYPVTPAVFLALVVISWVQGLLQRPLPTGAALGTIVLGVIVFLLGRRMGWLTSSGSLGEVLEP